MFGIYKDGKLLYKKRFGGINNIKNTLKDAGNFGQFDIIEYSLKGDHKQYKISINRNGKNEKK